MQDCINRALERNPQILKAQEQIKLNKGVLVQAYALTLPHASITGVLQHEDPNRFDLLVRQPGVLNTAGPIAFQQLSDTWQVGLRVTQTVYAGGRITGQINIAHLQEESALYNLTATIDEIVLQVREAFNEVLLNQSLIQVAEQSVHEQEQALENQKRKFEAGEVTRLNVLRSEVELANQKPLLIHSRNNYRIALTKLGRLMAIDFSTTSSTPTDFSIIGELQPEIQAIDLESALDAAVKNRPELKGLEKQVKANEEQIRVDYSNYFPIFSIFGGYDFLGQRTTGQFSNHQFGDMTQGYVGGVQFDWNIFDGLDTSGRLKQSRARLAASKLDVDDQRRQIDLEVRQAYSRLKEAGELIESQKKNVEQAAEALHLAEAHFDAGIGTQLDILKSQVDLTQARQNELQARYEYANALAELQRATGIATQYVDADERVVPALPVSPAGGNSEESAPKLRAPAVELAPLPSSTTLP